MAMLVPLRRGRGLLLATCAVFGTWGQVALAQGTSAGASAAPVPTAPVTYTPMRRPGSASVPVPTVPAAPAPPPPAASPPQRLPTPWAPAAGYPPPRPSAVAPAQGYPSYTPAPGAAAGIAATEPGAGYLAPSAPQPFYTPGLSHNPSVVSEPAVTTGQGALPVETVSAAARPAPSPSGRRALGLGLDVGAPDGVALGLVVAPADWLRLQAAFGTNTAGLGYRGGVTFVPVGFGPSFTFEAGHCNMAETNSLIRTMFNAPTWAKPYVREVGYTYFNGHLGVEYVRRGLTVFLHGGYTYLLGSVGTSEAVVVDNKTNTTATIAEGGTFSAHTLSAKLGIIYMFGGT